MQRGSRLFIIFVVMTETEKKFNFSFPSLSKMFNFLNQSMELFEFKFYKAQASHRKFFSKPASSAALSNLNSLASSINFSF